MDGLWAEGGELGTPEVTPSRGRKFRKQYFSMFIRMKEKVVWATKTALLKASWGLLGSNY